MKTLFSIIAFAIITVSAVTAQDKVIKVNGDTLKVAVTAVNEQNISFTYPNETVVNSISKKTVQQIIYKSGRIEKFTEPVVINGEADFAKVTVTRDPSAVAGLTEKGKVEGKAMKAFANFNKLRDAATVEIQKDGARKGATIVLIQTDNQAESPLNNVTLTGVAYGY